MSRIIAIADAVVAEIGGQTWSLPLQAVRSYAPQYSLGELDTTHVTVVPKGLQTEIASRSSFQSDYQVDVCIQRHLENLEAATVDAMMALVQEIADHWRIRGITIGDATAVCVKIENDPVYAPEHLPQMQVFTSVLTLTFRLVEEL